MNDRLLDIGKDWGARIKGLFESPLQADAPPLELLQAVLDDLERRVVAAGRGRRTFPYSAVAVRLSQPAADTGALAATFDELPARLRERLSEAGCTLPAALETTVEILDAAPAGWRQDQLFAVECRRQVAAASTTRAPAAIEITVLKGTAEEAIYTFSGGQISIGRTAEAIDDLGRARRNRVAFVDTADGITETVGRAHARLRADPSTGGYLVFDDGSRNGTSIVRRGETIRVAPRDPRGVRIHSGDEIQVGRAVLGIRIIEGPSPQDR